MLLTEAQLQEIAQRVAAILRAGSKNVGEVPQVDTLAGITSLPAIRYNGGVAEVVRATITTLGQPAADAAAVANTAASAANTAAGNANSKAALATEAASAANAAAGNANSKAALATEAASGANTAAGNANSAAIGANNAASGANSAAESANKAAATAIANTNPLVIPTELKVEYPPKITLGNNRALISAKVLPQYVLQNILFQYTGTTVEVDPVTGKITPLNVGSARIHIIPIGRTLLRGIAEIQVVVPTIRRLSASGIRRMHNGQIRLT
jgi:hypothetical protein